MIAITLLAQVALIAALETAVAAPPAPPGPATAPKNEILGVWKGTSTCTNAEGNEFCRDETVVYHVTDVADQPATVSLKAARIVDDFIQPMYALYFTYRPEKKSWTSEFERPSRSGVWAFVIDGDTMTGTAAVLPDMTVVRNVVATRTTKDRVLEPQDASAPPP